MSEVKYEDFRKLDIRVGSVLSAEKVPETEKLVKLILDMGDHQRQIVAGVAEVFKDPNELVGKQIPVLVNLEPSSLRGEESRGMILAVSVGGKPVLLVPEEDVPSGSPIT